MKKYLTKTLQHEDWISGKKGAHPSYGNPADKKAREAFFHLVDVEKPESILDVGCGKGRDWKFINERNVRYVGVDPYKVNIEWARHRYPKGDFRLGFMQKLPFESDSFDWIWMMGVLKYIPKNQLATGFMECMRIAKKKVFFCSSSRKGSTMTERYNMFPRGLPLKIWRVSYHPAKGIEYLMWEIDLCGSIDYHDG